MTRNDESTIEESRLGSHSRRGRPSNPTMKDVAAAAGVSGSTVSRAFQRPELIADETRERILKTAESLGFRPNRHASALMTGRTGLIGLLVPDIENPFFYPMIRGAERRITASNGALLLVDSKEKADSELRLISQMSNQVDGFVLASTRLSRAEIGRVAKESHVVLINRTVAKVPSIVVDNTPGIRQLVQHLVALGHTKVAYLSGPEISWSNKAREDAIGKFGARAGLEVTVLGPFPPTFLAGPQAAEMALASGATAFVAFNSLMALGILKHLEQRGTVVPDQISVVGCDEIFGAELPTPSLTTLAAPVEELGRLAADLLLDNIDKELLSRDGRQLSVDSQLIVRRSTGSATKGQR